MYCSAYRQLEDLLADDDPLAGRDRTAEAVQQRGLAGLRTAGDDDVEPGCDRRREERGRVNGQRPELDELVEMVRAHHELGDVSVSEQCI